MRQHYISDFHLRNFSNKRIDHKHDIRVGFVSVEPNGEFTTSSYRKTRHLATIKDLYENDVLEYNVVERELSHIESASGTPMKLITDFDVDSDGHTNNLVGIFSNFIGNYLYTLILRHPKNLGSEVNRRMFAALLRKDVNVVTDADMFEALHQLRTKRMAIAIEEAYVVRTYYPVALVIENPVHVEHLDGDSMRLSVPIAGNMVLVATLKVSNFLRNKPLPIIYYDEVKPESYQTSYSRLLLNSLWDVTQPNSLVYQNKYAKQFKRVLESDGSHPVIGYGSKIADVKPIINDNFSIRFMSSMQEDMTKVVSSQYE